VMNERYWASAGASDDSEPGLTISTPRTLVFSTTLAF